MLVHVRKLGDASPSAIGTRKIFNPVVASFLKYARATDRFKPGILPQ
jgi:hypothetical protein